MAENGRKRVLLVDDNAASLRVLENAVSDPKKFEITGRAANGAEAVKLYKMHKPDVVLMDIVMPIMDGLQALRIIMQMDRQANVLIVSSVGGVAEKSNEAIRLGAKGVVTKPFDNSELVKTISSRFP